MSDYNGTGGSSKLLYSIGLALGVTAVSSASYWYYKYWKKDVMPQKWRRVGTLDQINLFPIKSCAPLKRDASFGVDCELLGLRLGYVRDRGLMLVDDNNEMVTARVYPRMVLIETKMLGPAVLLLSAPGMEDLELLFGSLADEAPGKDVHIAVWGSKVDAMLCGDKYDQWFSEFVLNKKSGLHLVYYPYPKPMRPLNARIAKEPFITKDDPGSFHDATSYMLLNLASIKELNTRLPRDLNPLQFRGNFHLKMDVDEPYAEDNWSWVKIGNDAVFRVVAPCTRCIFPNINVNTGERDPNGQPLKTLKTYRLWKKYPSPAFGILLGMRQPGRVKADDVIYIEDK